MSKFKILFILLFFDLFTFVVSFCLKIYLQPIAIVAPHHNIVKESRLEFFKQIKQKRPVTKKIIIVGPDHFSPNQNGLYYSNQNWELSNGLIQFNSGLELEFQKYLSLQNGVLKNDHAIYNILPDIKTVWPQAKVFPILIGQNYPSSNLENLINQFNVSCKSDCLLVASVDFSHYLPATLANVHDQKSIYNLSTQNLKEIPKLEVDSPQSLYVMTKFSQLKQAQNWELYSHTNSGELINNFDIETTTHVQGSFSHSFYHQKISPIITFTITPSLVKEKNINSLGERFFYGTDHFNNYSPENIFKIPKDVIISGYQKENKIYFSIFPIENKNGAAYFLRGESKINNFNSFLKNLDLNSNCHINHSNQTIFCMN